MKIEPHFWKHQRVLLTGHTGFKGSWLTLWLSLLGAKVYGIALPPNTDPALFELAQVRQRMQQHHEVDIRNAEAVLTTLQAIQPDVVFHMAAQPLVRASYQDPIQTYATNVMGTAHVMEAIRHTPSVRAVVSVTTDKCYENRAWLWPYREEEPLGGHDPYSSSKACADWISQSYRRSFLQAQGVGVATARAGNVIGGGDWAADRLIPDTIKAWLHHQPVAIRYPKAVRPWQHVLEPLAGYMLLAQQLTAHPTTTLDAWNFGPQETDHASVEQVLHWMAQHWGYPVQWQPQLGEHPHEAALLRLDVSRAKHHLGWQPCWSLSQTLQRIIDWYQAWHRGEPIQALCLQQIQDYMEQHEYQHEYQHKHPNTRSFF